MSLVVHRADDGAALVAGLAEVLAVPPSDPFTPDVVAVPARGIERWIAQRLSHVLGAGPGGDGVCARVEFPRPEALLDAAVSSASPEHAASVQAWEPGRALWAMVEALDACPPEQAWCAPLLRHLSGDGSLSTRRLAVARRLTRLLAALGQARPELLVAWAAGRDDVPADLAWQPELWRRLRAQLGAPAPAELLQDACAQLRATGADLPERLSLYGVSRLDTSRLQVLAALAQRHEVHLWLHHPSRTLWEELAAQPPVVLRAAAPQPAVHPLLASLSRDVRELQLRLQDVASDHRVVHHGTPAVPVTLLEHLQDGLRRDVVPVPVGVPAHDRSVQVHACHGRARQVEVLREVVVGLLADDPSLEPRDVLVLCPDVEEFAPLLAAVFDSGTHPGGRLRVSVADRSPRRTNPLLEVAATLLELAVGRVTGSQVLDLAGRPAVRRRFGFDDDDLEQLRAWTAGSGVRWGLSAEHRAAWQMGGVAQGTWRAGLDRLLLGVALDEDAGLFGGALAHDDVDSASAALLGRWAELVDRLEVVVTALSGRAPLAHWLDTVQAGVDALADVPFDGDWQRAQLAGELQDLRDAAGLDDGTAGPELCLADVTSLLGERLQGRPTSTSFRTGGMTVCTLTPMRSVPHRVVCLLGMDDGALPRAGVPDGDDVLAREPRPGERDPRSEDRQLLLDALFAARQTLVVTYSGNDARTGAPQPPAVPLGELLDVVRALAPGREPVTRHPLQPFDARCFTAPLRSFDRSALAGARAAAAPRVPAPPFVRSALAPAASSTVELVQLVQFWRHPARAFLRQRLEVQADSYEQELDDTLPVELGGLQGWAVGERMLAARLRGVPPAQVWDQERARGHLPPGPLGERALRALATRTQALTELAAPLLEPSPRTVGLEVALAGGRLLSGAVHGVRGSVLLTVTCSTLGPRHTLQAWIELLAATVAEPGTPWTAAVVGRDGEGAQGWQVGPLEPVAARDTLEELVRLRDVGLRTPLPLPLKTGEAYVRRRETGARKAWADSYAATGEASDAEHVLLWGRQAPFEVLRSWVGPGHDLDFASLARAVWGPVCDAEQAARQAAGQRAPQDSGATP